MAPSETYFSYVWTSWQLLSVGALVWKVPSLVNLLTWVIPSTIIAEVGAPNSVSKAATTQSVQSFA